MGRFGILLVLICISVLGFLAVGVLSGIWEVLKWLF